MASSAMTKRKGVEYTFGTHDEQYRGTSERRSIIPVAQPLVYVFPARYDKEGARARSLAATCPSLCMGARKRGGGRGGSAGHTWREAGGAERYFQFFPIVNFLRNIQIIVQKIRRGENDGLTMLHRLSQGLIGAFTGVAPRACARSTPLTGTWLVLEFPFDRDGNLLSPHLRLCEHSERKKNGEKRATPSLPKSNCSN